MKIKFSLPLIDDDVIKEVNDCLINTGWLSSGPKVAQLEKELARFTNIDNVLCVNSWTSGARLVLRWFDIGPGDEVIIPAYTYSATALCIMNIGAKVVMVDINDDFNINIENIRSAITPNTKAIIPVDIGGWPCDYKELMELVDSETVKMQFCPKSKRQRTLGRPLVLSDSAHSIGAEYKGKKASHFGDFTIFSLHSAKNITSGEGGAICINLPSSFDNDSEYLFLRTFALNGQNKSAFDKNKIGGWRYDIIDQGLKVNMPDLSASVALSQIRRYASALLPERKRIFEQYNKGFEKFSWAILPPYMNEYKKSSCHLYNLRFENILEQERDEMIEYISSKEVGVNVHYIPMAMLTLFKSRGYDIADYPNTFKLYQNEITLPLYNGLSSDQIDYVIEVVISAYESVKKNSIVL